MRRSAAALLLVAPSLILLAGPPAAAAPPTAASATWQPEPATYHVAKSSDVTFPMPDGTELVGDVYRPADASGSPAPGRFPVLLEMSPYGPGGQGGQNPVTHGTTFTDVWSGYFVARGYIYVEFDARGTSRSAGDFTIMDPRQAQDYLDMVDYCAHHLAGSSGVVGLNGQSYLGLDQVFMGRLLRPGTPLRAMAPSAVGADLFREPFRAGGMPGAFVEPYDGVEIASQLYPVMSLPAASPTHAAAVAPGRLTTLLYNGRLATDSYTGGSLAYEDSFWLQRRIVDSVPAIVRSGVPVLMTSGDSDFFANGSLELYAAFQNVAAGRPMWAPMDPSLHPSGRYQLVYDTFSDLSATGAEYLPYELEWYDTFLKGAPTGIETTPSPLHVLEAGDSRWVSMPGSAYPMTRSYTPMYLGFGNTLSTQPSTGSDSIAWGPNASLTYTSRPFVSGATLAGPITASIFATATTSDVELIATLNDVAPDGTVTSVHGDLEPDGALIGSQRAIDPARSWTDSAGRLVHPYHPFTTASQQAVPTGSVQRFDVELHARIAAVAPGHALQLVITTVDNNASPMSNQLPNLAGGTYEIEHTAAAASYVDLPLLPAHAFPSSTDPAAPPYLGRPTTTPTPLTADLNVDPANTLGEPEVQVDPVDPATIVVGENNTGVSVSHDRGRTWRQVSLPNPGDNVLAVQPDGTFVYSSLDGGLESSKDGGNSWSSVGNWAGAVAAQLDGADTLAGREAGCNTPSPAGPVSADPSRGPGPQWIGCDRPWLTADRRTGTLYVSFADHNDTGDASSPWEIGSAECKSTVDTGAVFHCGRQYVSASHDGGRTWSTFHAVDSPEYPMGVTGGFSGQPVASDGVLATAYIATTSSATCRTWVVFETSGDDGATWSRHVVAGATAAVRSGTGPIVADPLGGPSLGGVPASAAVSDDPAVLFEPYVAVDPSKPGRYAFMLLDNSRTHLLVDVTSDGGRSWQPPAVLAEDGSNQRWHPWLAYGLTGALGAMWRTQYADGSYAVWAAVSPRGDGRFAPPVRLSSSPSPPPVEVIAGDDASGLALDAHSLHAVWGDHRGGRLSPWYGRYDFSRDPAVTAMAPATVAAAVGAASPALLPNTASAGGAAVAATAIPGIAAMLMASARRRRRARA